MMHRPVLGARYFGGKEVCVGGGGWLERYQTSRPFVLWNAVSILKVSQALRMMMVMLPESTYRFDRLRFVYLIGFSFDLVRPHIISFNGRTDGLNT